MECINIGDGYEFAKSVSYCLKKMEDGFCVWIPDFGVGTQGNSLTDAMEMAGDAIGLMGIDMQDDGKDIPEPYSVSFEAEKGDISMLVDIDFTGYRRKVDLCLGDCYGKRTGSGN